MQIMRKQRRGVAVFFVSYFKQFPFFFFISFLFLSPPDVDPTLLFPRRPMSGKPPQCSIQGVTRKSARFFRGGIPPTAVSCCSCCCTSCCERAIYFHNGVVTNFLWFVLVPKVLGRARKKERERERDLRQVGRRRDDGAGEYDDGGGGVGGFGHSVLGQRRRSQSRRH